MTAREIQIFNRKILRLTFILWMLLVALVGYTSVFQNINLLESQGVDSTLWWSILDFTLFDFPRWCLFLMCILGLELILLKNPWKMVAQIKIKNRAPVIQKRAHSNNHKDLTCQRS